MSTMPISDETPLDPDDELLVAYLDGELERSERTEVENRLLDDETLRVRLQQLQSGWDLLEELPDPAPNTKLVETTLELAVADLVSASPPKSSMQDRFRYPVGIFLACALGSLIAVVGTRTVQRRSFEKQLRELAIAESMDAYFYAGDLNLMRSLAADSQWTQMVKASQQLGGVAEGEGNSSDAMLIADVPIDQREDLIRKMPMEQRTQYYSRWERYNRLDEKSRAKIQEVADVVAKQTDHGKLIKTMRAYANWRESLPAESVDLIEGSEGEAQKEALAEAIGETMAAISERSSRKLSDDAIESIYFVLRQILAQRLQELPEDQRESLLKMQGRSPGRSDSEWRMLFWMFGAQDPRRRMPPSAETIQRPDSLRPDEIVLIRLILAPEDLVILHESSGGGDGRFEPMVLRTWAEEAIRRKSPWQRRENMSTLDRFMDVPADRRQEFELLPPAKILEELDRQGGRFSD
ncbi:anti-sigma factor family protein [Rubripirellula reticaptiva]|uniref:Zinc-finger domain-containing protein n=1 Tax=Rubripirellula reticaptiva TaxID=2528013 RepID=A0A5C6EN28_9BACT|nr:hypothetical protein [Rubripirellula reticaptiva]TWU49764.1 hypothetical protein Poly59_43890 [Rubripirellula reticaptiva]